MIAPVGLRRLHHVGFIVASISDPLSGFLQSLDAVAESGIIHDPLQQVNVLFLRPGGDSCCLIELVEPNGENSPVRRFLEKSGGMHHLCYEVDQIEPSLAVLKEHKGLVVSKPKPAVAFNGRRVAWVMTRERLLLELLETPEA
jgi:methylmalonyl-CoA/ethylmalonyl-CoA epimerase